MKIIFLFDWSVIPKVANPFATIAFLATMVFFSLISLLNSKTPTNNKTVIIFSIVILLLGVITLGLNFSDNQSLKRDISLCETEMKRLLKEKELIFAENEKNKAFKDSFNIAKKELTNQLETLTKANHKLELKYQESLAENNKYRLELQKHKSYQYSFKEGFAAVRDPKTGMWGYQRKGQSLSEVEFIYIAACNFSEGRAGVVYKSTKWGFVDKSLGPPILNCLYDEAEAFDKGKARVKYKGEWIFINSLGKRVK